MTVSAALFTARALVDELVCGGVRTVCLAPGSRSTALALAVAERTDLASRIFTDERSMGFFALGLARASGEPVALVCTSGTAAANLLPAVCEASLGGGALVVMTADRPPELRDCAAPQTIHQQNLFGIHARWYCDVPMLDSTEASARVLRSIAARAVCAAMDADTGPVHLNVPLREPFVDASFPARERFDIAARHGARPFTDAHAHASIDSQEILEIASRVSRARRGVIVCAGREVPAADVAALAKALGWPILADPLSGLRFGPHDRSHLVDAVEPLLREEWLRSELRPDAIIRFGLTPVPRAVQRWLDEAWPAEHVVVAPSGWPDAARSASAIVRAEPAAFCRLLAPACTACADVSEWRDRWLTASACARAALDGALEAETVLFDGTVLSSVERALPDSSTLFVGNSMPVRDAETFLASGARRLRVLASRGASGIDGVLSAALGVAAAVPGPTAVVLGDLSFLHDSGALVWAARERIPLLVVVVNNDGGGIFSWLPLHDTLADAPPGGGRDVFERFFATPHGTDLARVAAVTGSFFARVRERSDLDDTIAAALAASASGPAVIEVVTDREAARTAQQVIVRAACEAVSALTLAARRTATA